MEIYILDQLKNILYSVILGLIFGVMYDIIRVGHFLCRIASYSDGEYRMKKTVFARIMFALFDLVYSLTVIASFSVFIYLANYGEFRWFLLFGSVFGFTVYYKTVGRVVMFFSEAIVSFIEKAVYTVVIKPMRFLIRLIYRLTLEKLIIAVKHEMKKKKSERLSRHFSDIIRFDYTKTKGSGSIGKIL